MEPLRQELRDAARRHLRLAIFTLLIVVAPSFSASATTTIFSSVKEAQSEPQTEQIGQPERRTFWEKLFRMPPLRKRLEKTLVEEWKFSEVRPRQIEELLSEDAEETRAFFVSGSNARQYQRLVKEFGVGFETKEGKVVDESIETMQVEVKYDRMADTTTVQCNLVELGEGAPKLTVQANASFRGKEPNENVIFWLGLSSYKGGASRRTERSFKEVTTLYLTMDSARLEVPIKDYRNNFYELNRLLAESARAEISREDLRKLLDARSVEGRWGSIEFKLSDAALVSLKDFISRQAFAASDR